VRPASLAGVVPGCLPVVDALHPGTPLHLGPGSVVRLFACSCLLVLPHQFTLGNFTCNDERCVVRDRPEGTRYSYGTQAVRQVNPSHVAANSRGLGPYRSSVQQLRLDNGCEEPTSVCFSPLVHSRILQGDPVVSLSFFSHAPSVRDRRGGCPA